MDRESFSRNLLIQTPAVREESFGSDSSNMEGPQHEKAKQGEPSSPIKGGVVPRAGFFLSLCSHHLARVMGRVMGIVQKIRVDKTPAFWMDEPPGN